MMQRIANIGMACALVILIAGCNSTEQTLQPIPGEQLASGPNTDNTAPVDAFPNTSPAGTPQLSAAASPAFGTSAQATAPAGQVRGRIRFTPVIGAPVNAVTPLSRQLAVEARNRGLAILSASDQGGDNVLKGYFSADNFGGQTTVFYVWDVLDAAGNRLHRIQGQETVAGGSGDPWTSVPADVMERIAARSIADYVAWRGL